MKEERK